MKKNNKGKTLYSLSKIGTYIPDKLELTLAVLTNQSPRHLRNSYWPVITIPIDIMLVKVHIDMRRTISSLSNKLFNVD